MLDCHCHLDLYTAPSAVARRAEAAGVFTIFVTNSPSAYQQSRTHVARHARVRLALGLHPLLAEQHLSERKAFEALAHQTSFIGEVGLDFSPDGKATSDIQQESFAFVLRVLANQPKFISIHSRRAEARVLELLRQAKRTPVVFHWYTGPLNVLRSAISDGHYFSINPAMVRSPKGQKIVQPSPETASLPRRTDHLSQSAVGRPNQQMLVWWKITVAASGRCRVLRLARLSQTTFVA